MLIDFLYTCAISQDFSKINSNLDSLKILENLDMKKVTHDKLSSHYETFPVHFTPTVMLTVCTVSLIGRWYVKYDYVGSLISVHQPGRRRSNNLSFAELLTTIAAGRHCLLSWPSRPSSRIPSPRNLLIDSKGLLHQATGFGLEVTLLWHCAPEISLSSSKSYDIAVDVCWSLGCIFSEMVSLHSNL